MFADAPFAPTGSVSALQRFVVFFKSIMPHTGWDKYCQRFRGSFVSTANISPSIKKPSSFVFNDLAFKVAGEPGFEPRLTESESAVLPLNYSPTDVMCLYRPLYPSLQHLFLFYSVNNRRYTVYHKLRSHRSQNYSQYLRYNLVHRLTH